MKYREPKKFNRDILNAVAAGQQVEGFELLGVTPFPQQAKSGANCSMNEVLFKFNGEFLCFLQPVGWGDNSEEAEVFWGNGSYEEWPKNTDRWKLVDYVEDAETQLPLWQGALP